MCVPESSSLRAIVLSQVRPRRRTRRSVSSTNVDPQEARDGKATLAEVETTLEVRPKTSLLSLPDDLLYSIYEDIHEERFLDVDIRGPLRAAEILVNKRIFSVARPLWFSCLSISENQLDDRISRLFSSDLRRQELRRLELDLVSTFTRLTETIISQIPLLTHLSITAREGGNELVNGTLVRVIGSIPTLRHLAITLCDYSVADSRLVAEQCQSAGPRTPRERSFHLSQGGSIRDVFRNGLVRKFFYKAGSSSYRSLDWKTLYSFTCAGVGEYNTSPVGPLLDGLAAALKYDKTQGFALLPLRRLSLSLEEDFEWYNLEGHDPTTENFDDLFRLLSKTQIRSLEFTLVTEIPDFHHSIKVPSIETLRLQGTCSFHDEGNFRTFPDFLQTFPSLRRLELVGSEFFGGWICIDDLWKLDRVKSHFFYPHLSALLSYLRESSLEVFTFRDGSQMKELRWTRNDVREDFVRECWTL